MDRFLAPKAGVSSSSAPARSAAVVPNGSSAVTGKRPTAPATKATQAAAKKKKHKPSALELLVGPESSGKKAGLSLALRKGLLSGPPSRKRQSQSLGASVLQQRRTEKTTPTTQEQRASSSSAVAQHRSRTDKLKKKRPTAAAAAATAQEEGWFDIPSDNGAQPTSAAPAPAPRQQVAVAPPLQRAKVAPLSRTPPPAPAAPTPAPRQVAARTPPLPTAEVVPPPRTRPPASAASASPAQQVAARAPSTPRADTAPAPQSLPPAATSHNLPEERPTAKRQQRAVLKINEFFPRRVVSPSASPPPAPAIPVQRPRGWATQNTRPPTVARRSRGCSDREESVDSEGSDCDDEGRIPWDPDADHCCRWREDSDDEEEAEEEAGGARGGNGSPAQGLSMGADRRSGAEPAATVAAPEPAGLGSASTGAPASASASAGVAARSAARSEYAARAAAAAERRAARAATNGTGEGRGLAAVRAEEVAPDNGLLGAAVEVDAEPEAAAQVLAVSGAAAAAAARDASAGGPQVPEEAGPPVEEDGAHAAAEKAQALPWPCRRKRGSASLFLSQRQRTGGLRSRGVGVGNDGRDTFQRQALSKVLANGLRIQRLRLGRTSNSRVGAGVARGEPEGQGIHGRVAGGVTCMEFDSQGWHLAVAGENVTVYDFDDYLPKNPPLKHTLVAGARAYLQPSDCFQTKRTVSCVRWNPTDEEQLAVSYMNFDQVEVYDLRDVEPDGSVTPVQTLLPSSSPLSVNSGGRGHLCLEFVRRGPPGKRITHLVAGGRGGVFRVWRLVSTRGAKLPPYLQGHVSGVSLSPGGPPRRSDVTAVCCLNPDTVLVGTNLGQLATFSLNRLNQGNFQSSKVAHRTAAWSLNVPTVWGVEKPAATPSDPSNFSVQFLRLSLDHGARVVLCGLRSGRLVIFDTTCVVDGKCGRALGITEPYRGESVVGFCPPPAAAPYARPTVCTGGAPLTEAEGAKLPYGGGSWGPVLLACCKSSSAAGAGEDLVVLATSAQAALDSWKRRQDRGTTRSPRKSGMRPGPGWEVGEVGGGGFRVEKSEGYELCLPAEVVAATPGRNRVRLSKDVRGYLCPRGDVWLLRSGVVTSSIMIGKEKHSVEAVNNDGMELVLDRKYRGPAVEGPPGGHGDGEAGAGARAGEAAFPRRARFSDGGGGGEDAGADDDGSEVDDPEPGGSSDDAGSGRRSRASWTSPAAAPTTSESKPPPVADRESAAAAAGASAGSDQPWGRAWRPNGVRVFAKLRAFFGDRQQQQQSDEGMVGVRRSVSVGGEEAPTPPFALYEVVARAGLDLPGTAEPRLAVTAITSHPRNNFVLVGLKDGTVATVLPEGKREKVGSVPRV